MAIGFLFISVLCGVVLWGVIIICLLGLERIVWALYAAFILQLGGETYFVMRCALWLYMIAVGLLFLWILKFLVLAYRFIGYFVFRLVLGVLTCFSGRAESGMIVK